MVVVPPVLAFAVLPVGRNMVALDLPETGLLFFLMVGTAVELGVFMAGWSSHNKYSLLGAMRALAQLLSYELPLVLSTVTVVMLTGSLSLVSIIEQQDRVVGGFLTGWNVFTPGARRARCCSSSPPSPRPTDPRSICPRPNPKSSRAISPSIPASSSPCFPREYLGLFAISGLGITLFLGGWLPLFTFLDWVPSWVWFFGKLGGLMLVFIWLRGTLPRLRMDQLMQFAWQFLLPMSLINLVIAGVWHFTTPWPAVLRWALGIALLAGPWVLYARAFAARHPARQYRHLA